MFEKNYLFAIFTSNYKAFIAHLITPVYICYQDASKAFDRINHCTHFRKLLAMNVLTIAFCCSVLGILRNYLFFKGECLSPQIFSSF